MSQSVSLIIFANNNNQNLLLYHKLYFVAGTLFENHRKERLSSIAVGPVHHAERRLSAAHQLKWAYSGVHHTRPGRSATIFLFFFIIHIFIE